MTKEKTSRPGRRTFLVGLLTGAGVVSALGTRREAAVAGPRAPEPGRGGAAEPILYRRTAEAERYYRTLYA